MKPENTHILRREAHSLGVHEYMCVFLKLGSYFRNLLWPHTQWSCFGKKSCF